jgi:hypothetical protein
LERQLFLVFSFVLFCFVCCNKRLDPNKFRLEKLSCFSFAKNTPFFTLIVQWVFSFSRTAFSFHFLPWFLFRSSYIFASRCVLTSGPYWFSSKELFQKGSNGVGKEKKKFMQKSGTKRSLFRLQLRLLHAMLDVFLIVCLVFCCSMTCLKLLRLLNEPLKKSCVVFIIWKH